MTRRHAVAVVAVLSALSAACGTRVDTDERVATDDGLGPEPTTATAPSGDGATTTTAPGAEATPCGPGDASGATDVGVTDTEITITTIQDISGPAPGLFQAEQDAIDAFVAYCNSLGGINGRTLKLVKKDSSFFEPRPAVVEACRDSFALVGHAMVFDDQIVDVATECGIPEVPAFSGTPEHSKAANVIHAVANNPTEWGAGPAFYFAEQFPDAVEHAAVLYADAGTTKNRTQMQKESWAQAGFVWKIEKPIALVELNWGPIVDELRREGIGYVTVWSDLTAPVKLVKELRAQGVEIPIVDIGSQSYDAAFLEQAGEAAEGSYAGVAMWPLEEADANPEMQLYFEWLEEVRPGAKPAALGTYTWSSGLLFATAVQALGSEVTRDGLLGYLRDVHEWDGHGIHAPGDPGGNTGNACFVLLQVRDGAFERVFPDEGFACDERYRATVTDPSL